MKLNHEFHSESLIRVLKSHKLYFDNLACVGFFPEAQLVIQSLNHTNFILRIIIRVFVWNFPSDAWIRPEELIKNFIFTYYPIR